MIPEPPSTVPLCAKINVLHGVLPRVTDNDEKILVPRNCVLDFQVLPVQTIEHYYVKTVPACGQIQPFHGEGGDETFLVL